MTTSSMPGGEDFSVLVVCTGNICRSPALERLLRAAFGPYSGVHVESAGTSAVVGDPIHPPMAKLLGEVDVDTSGFSARQLDERMVRRADLVLGFTREHRSAAVRLWPGAVRHSYTFLELARMMSSVDPRDVDREVGPMARSGDRLSTAVALAAAYRRTPGHTGPDDVVDPYDQSSDVYAEVFSLIVENSRPFVRVAVR